MSETTSITRCLPPAARQVPPSQDTRLSPAETFPVNLTALTLVQVQVLHSRITCQLESEYLSADGPHPETLDRHQQLREELDTRRRGRGDP